MPASHKLRDFQGHCNPMVDVYKMTHESLHVQVLRPDLWFHQAREEIG